MLLVIDSAFRDEIARYLETRPWREVKDAMPVLLGLPPLPPVGASPEVAGEQ